MVKSVMHAWVRIITSDNDMHVLPAMCATTRQTPYIRFTAIHNTMCLTYDAGTGTGTGRAWRGDAISVRPDKVGISTSTGREEAVEEEDEQEDDISLINVGSRLSSSSCSSSWRRSTNKDFKKLPPIAIQRHGYLKIRRNPAGAQSMGRLNKHAAKNQPLRSPAISNTRRDEKKEVQ